MIAFRAIQSKVKVTVIFFADNTQVRVIWIIFYPHIGVQRERNIKHRPSFEIFFEQRTWNTIVFLLGKVLNNVIDVHLNISSRLKICSTIFLLEGKHWKVQLRSMPRLWKLWAGNWYVRESLCWYSIFA